MSEEAAKAAEAKEAVKATDAEEAAKVAEKKETAKATEVKETKKAKKSKDGSAKLDKLVDEIGSLTVIELAELVDTLKEKFSIQAVAVAPAVAAAGAGSAEAAAGEKNEFNIVLTDVGGQKLQVLKEVRSITGLGLKEAKELIDNLPGNIKEGAAKAEAEEIKKKLESVGAKVELK